MQINHKKQLNAFFQALKQYDLFIYYKAELSCLWNTCMGRSARLSLSNRNHKVCTRGKVYVVQNHQSDLDVIWRSTWMLSTPPSFRHGLNICFDFVHRWDAQLAELTAQRTWLDVHKSSPCNQPFYSFQALKRKV